MIEKCAHCDPEYYVVYGTCPRCNVQVRPPLQKFNINEENMEQRFRRLAKGLTPQQKLLKMDENGMDQRKR